MCIEIYWKPHEILSWIQESTRRSNSSEVKAWQDPLGKMHFLTAVHRMHLLTAVLKTRWTQTRYAMASFALLLRKYSSGPLYNVGEFCQSWLHFNEADFKLQCEDSLLHMQLHRAAFEYSYLHATTGHVSTIGVTLKLYSPLIPLSSSKTAI